MRADAGPPPPFDSPEEPYPFLTVSGPGGLRDPRRAHPRRSDRTGALPALGGRGDDPQAQGPPLVRAPGHREAGRGATPGRGRASDRTRLRGHGRRAHDRLLPRRRRGLGLAGAGSSEHDAGSPPGAGAALQPRHRPRRLCNDAGQGLLNAHALRVRERLLRLNARITGHRLLRGAVFPGGARLLDRPTARELREIAADVAEIVDLALEPQRRARPVRRHADPDRGAGQPTSVSSAMPLAQAGSPSTPAATTPSSTPPPALTIVTETDGDVLARFLVRAREVQTSVALLQSASRAASAPARPPAASPPG